MPEIKTRDIVREPIKVVDQTAAASRHMKEALVKAKEKARENSPAKEESPEEYASDKITGSAETAFYSGMHLAREAARGRKKAAATRADRVEDTKAEQPREQPRDQATEAGRKAAAKSAKKAAEEKRAAESAVNVPEPETSVSSEPLAHSDPAAPSPPGEAASHQPEVGVNHQFLDIDRVATRVTLGSAKHCLHLFAFLWRHQSQQFGTFRISSLGQPSCQFDNIAQTLSFVG